MKKILFLLLVCLIKLNAYEYLFYYNDKTSYDTQVKRAFFIDSNGKFVMRLYHNDSFDTINNINYVWLSCIKFNYSDAMGSYIKNDEFQNYFKNDLSFLNNLYTSNDTNRNAFLNYLYNENRFNSGNYINYENYELLYNSDGFAVESIVEGVWAGLYDDSERGSSGWLYDSSGTLIYVNAEPVNTFQQWLDPFVRSVVGCLVTAVDLIASPVGVVISVVFVMAILYFVVTVGRRAIQPFEGKVRKRFLGSHNEEV